jgi:LuxR family maltose regulon positive regulatory protein
VVPVYAVCSLVAARHGRPDEARGTAAIAKALLGRLDVLAPRAQLLGYLLLAEAAAALDHGAEARELAGRADRARARDGSATYLNQLLDLLQDQLSAGTSGRAGPHEALTPAELRVLNLLPTHLSMQDIADQLLVSRNTVKTHLMSIYRKFGVSSRGHAVLVAQRRGLLAE